VGFERKGFGLLSSRGSNFVDGSKVLRLVVDMHGGVYGLTRWSMEREAFVWGITF